MSTTNDSETRRAAIVERRDFLKRSAITLGAVGLGLGGVRELLASSDGAWARAYAGTGGAVEPFRMAVIGDSVMWGQGLAEQDKIHTKVLGYIAHGLNGRPVEKQVAAHSGAIIGLNAPDLNAQYATNGMSGEMPRRHPTIGWQATNQIQNPELVDLVLMNGGINDVDVLQILTMDYMISLDALRQRTRDLVGAQMQTLLTGTVMPRFPRATIVVSNYFPIISWDSAMDVVGTFTRLLFFPLGVLISLEVQRKLSDQSLAFHDESTKAMQLAVANANKQYGTDRVRFAPSGFYGSNAVGAWNAYLYSPAEPDPLAAARVLECPKFFTGNALELCKQAQMGHPNPKGALAYASNIHAAVKPLIPGWALPAATIAVDTKQVAVSVVTTTTTISSKTIVVSGKDSATGQALSGTVAINGATGALGQAITFPRCSSTETMEGPLGKPIPRKIYMECEGTVSVSGYPAAGFSA